MAANAQPALQKPPGRRRAVLSGWERINGKSERRSGFTGNPPADPPRSCKRRTTMVGLRKGKPEPKARRRAGDGEADAPKPTPRRRRGGWRRSENDRESWTRGRTSDGNPLVAGVRTTKLLCSPSHRPCRSERPTQPLAPPNQPRRGAPAARKPLRRLKARARVARPRSSAAGSQQTFPKVCFRTFVAAPGLDPRNWLGRRLPPARASRQIEGARGRVPARPAQQGAIKTPDSTSASRRLPDEASLATRSRTSFQPKQSLTMQQRRRPP